MKSPAQDAFFKNRAITGSMDFDEANHARVHCAAVCLDGEGSCRFSKVELSGEGPREKSSEVKEIWTCAFPLVEKAPLCAVQKNSRVGPRSVPIRERARS